MNEEEIFIDSIKLAEIFEKNNKHINERIKNILKKFPNLSNEYIKDTYISSRGREEIKYQITKRGLKAIIDNSRKNKNVENVIKFYNETFNENLSSEIYFLKDRYEDEFYKMISNIVPSLYIERQYPIGKYKVDFYVPNYNIIIEYDEEQYGTNTNKKLDEERMNYIKTMFYIQSKPCIELIRVKKECELDGLRELLFNITNCTLFKKEMTV